MPVRSAIWTCERLSFADPEERFPFSIIGQIALEILRMTFYGVVFMEEYASSSPPFGKSLARILCQGRLVTCT